MSSITPVQATVLSGTSLFGALVENEPIVDQLLPLLPWKAIDGYEEDVPTVTAATLGTASWPGSGGAVGESSAIPAVPAASYPLRRTVRDVIIDSFLVATRSGLMDLAQVQVDAAVRTVLYAVADGLINGDSLVDPAQIKGLKKSAPASQTVGASNDSATGGPILVSDVNRLLLKITANDGRADFILMNLATYRMWIHVSRAAGDPPCVGSVCGKWGRICTDCIDSADLCPDRVAVLTHHGVPVLVTEHIKSDETKGGVGGLTSAYALFVGEGQGLCLTYPARFGDRPFEVIRVFNPQADQERYRIALNVGLSLYTEAALARLDGILN